MEPGPSEGMVTLTHVLYGLHGFSALMGMLGPMLIVTAFLTGWPSIIAVIIIRGWIALAEGRPMPLPG